MTGAASDGVVSETRARELVAAERTRIETALGELGDDVDDERLQKGQQAGESWELGTDVATEAVAMALIAGLQGELEAVDRAEARIDAGTFGRSIEGGGPIPIERLEAAPLAERTIEEQRAFGGGGA